MPKKPRLDTANSLSRAELVRIGDWCAAQLARSNGWFPYELDVAEDGGEGEPRFNYATLDNVHTSEALWLMARDKGRLYVSRRNDESRPSYISVANINEALAVIEASEVRSPEPA